MKYILTYSFLALGLLACNSASKQTENTSKKEDSSKIQEVNQTTSSTEKEAKPTFTELRANTWFKGTLDKHPVWLYITYLEGESITALYGYESMNGAFIKLDGKVKGNNISLNYSIPQKNEKEEKFEGKLDTQKGSFAGKWSSGTKTLSFALELANPEIPTNSQEFLNTFAIIQAPFSVEEYSEFFLPNEKLMKKTFKDKQFARFIPNLKDFLGNTELKLSDAGGVLLGKFSLANGNSLALFTCNLDKEMAFNQDSYEVRLDGMVCAAILDKEGKVLATQILGNDGDDSYFIDFGFEVSSPTQIKTNWTFYIRGEMSVREEESTKTETFQIKGNKFEKKK